MAKNTQGSYQRQHVRAGFFDEDIPSVRIDHAIIQRYSADVRSGLESRASTGIQRRGWGFGRNGGSELHRTESMDWEAGED